MTQATGNAEVSRHFRQVSGAWGERYAGPPARMSDLDLQLRRATALGLLHAVRPPGDQHVALLDVGCGAGNLLERLDGSRWGRHGVDLVPEMVTAARERVPEGDFAVADVQRLPWGDEHFQAITCLGVLEYLADPPAALGELRRVLRPGGTLVISFPNAASWFRRLSRVEIQLETKLARLLRQWRRRPQATVTAQPRYRHQDWSLPAARTLLRGAGFEVAQVRCHTYGLWGRIGRQPWAVRLARQLSARLERPNMFTRATACTFVVAARRPPGEAERGGAGEVSRR